MNVLKGMATMLLLSPMALFATHHNASNTLQSPPIKNIESNAGGEFTIQCPPDIVVSCLSQVPDPDPSVITALGGCEGNDFEAFYGWEEWSGNDDVCSGEWIIQRQYYAFDPCENYAECFQYITIHDTVAPVFSETPEDISLICDDALEPPAELTATDDCGGSVPVTLEDTFDFETECPIAYQIHYIWTATDGCGNTNTHSQTVSYVDNDEPVILPFEEETIYVGCDESYEIPEPIVFETCSSAEIEITSDSIPGDCYGSKVYTYTATEECGNTASRTFTVQFTDDTPPVIDMGNLSDGFLTVDCDVQIEISIPFAYDDCGGEIPVSSSGTFTEGECDNDWYEKFIYTATDACGNMATDSATIHFVDENGPEFTIVPDDMFITCIEEVPAANSALLDAVDNCGEVTITHLGDDQEGGDCFASLYRTYRAYDACENFTDYIQVITVTDTIAPVLSGVPADAYVSCDNVPEVADVTAADNCDESVIVTYNQDSIPGNCPYNYTLIRTWSATDSCDNYVEDMQVIEVSDQEAPIITECASGMFYDCYDNIPEADISLITAVDNCGIVTITHEGDSFEGNECEGTIYRTYGATDECGNYTACVQVITYNDTVAPTLHNLPADTTYECSDTIPAAADVWASDNCDDSEMVEYMESDSAGECPQEYTIYRTWTASDACGNTVSHTQVINIEDNTAPVFNMQDSQVTVECYEDVVIPEPSAEDLCDDFVDISMDVDTIAGDCPNEWTVIYTWTATDDCENSADLTYTVNYVDNNDPVFTDTPDDWFYACFDGVPAADTGLLAAIDSCGDVTITHVNDDLVDEDVINRTYRATDQCGNFTDYVQVITYGATSLAVVNAGSDMNVCADSTAIALDGVVENAAETLWSGGAGVFNDPNNSSTNYTPGVEDVANGSTTLTLTVTDSLGCQASDSMLITFLSNTESSIVVNACDSYTAPDGFEYTTAGLYTAIIPNSAGCDSIITIDLSLTEIDTSVTSGSVSLLANADGATYQWLDCNNDFAPLTGETDSLFTAVENGSYALLIGIDSCFATSDCYDIVGVGINEQAAESLFNIFPNPNEGSFFVEMDSAAKIAIYDMTGRLVISERLEKGLSTINMSEYSSGIYIITSSTKTTSSPPFRIIVNK